MRGSRRLGAGLIGAALAGGLLAGSVLAADRTVTIAGFAFAPGSVTVSVGDTVTWRNDDSAGHTATAPGAFDTGSIPPGATEQITFAEAGTFAYVCSIHPTMNGTVIVEAAAGAPPPTDTLPVEAEATTDPTAAIAILLAVLGVAVLVSTLVFDRRDAR